MEFVSTEILSFPVALAVTWHVGDTSVWGAEVVALTVVVNGDDACEVA